MSDDIQLKDVLTEEVVSELYFEDASEDGRFETVETESVEDSGKSDYLSAIVRDTLSGKCYRIYGSRSGSYFTDYEYFFEAGGVEVERRSVTREEWVEVSKK